VRPEVGGAAGLSGPVGGAFDCTVVIPTYNERENVELLIEQILALPRFRVLVVDDSSPDGTGTLVQEIAEREPRVALLSRPGKLGLGSAYIGGFKLALEHGAAFVFEMDADFSHDPIQLPALLEAAEDRCDLVIGSRYVAGGRTEWSFSRELLSRAGNLYARLLLQLPVQDALSGFRCYRRQVLETIDLDAVAARGFMFQVEMVFRAQRAGFVVGEVPIVFKDRERGKSKMSAAIVGEALARTWQLRWEALRKPRRY
jgi:dolichol-phosphate mannosyltransferase